MKRCTSVLVSIFLGALASWGVLAQTKSTTAGPHDTSNHGANYSVRTLPLPDDNTGDVSMDYIAYDPGTNSVWVPGGNTGWHSHPGPSIISVKSGTATEYHADDPVTPLVHPAGTSFVDDGQGAHIIVNEGTTDLELVAFQILPKGAPRRIDEPAP